MSTIKRDSITVVRPETIDDRGTPVPDWSDTTETVWSGCRVQPRVAEEETARGRQAVVSFWTVYGPYDMDVDEHDRIVWGAATYEVHGHVRKWQSPTGAVEHVEFDVRRVEG